MRRVFLDSYAVPVVLLILVVVVFAGLDAEDGHFISAATVFSVFETFATIGMVALGLGITMIMREFDLSVAGVFSMAGCIAVLTGAAHPWLGIACAVLAGLGVGAVQGLLITRLRLSSVGVTLGGLLISVGIAYVLTQSTSIAYDNLDIAMAMGHRYLDLLSIRSLCAVGLFFVTALIGVTRIGRDAIATGSDRMAAQVAGVAVEDIVTGAFTFSGACAALSGALLSYSLAFASPAGVSDVLVPAATAAIVGGVSLGGGSGRPLGIACGVLVLAVLRSGFNAVGWEPWISVVATSVLLLLVATLDASRLLEVWRRRAVQDSVAR